MTRLTIQSLFGRRKFSKRLISLGFILICVASVAEALRTCDPEDFTYEYTECSPNGERWRVGVLKEPGKCEGGTVPFPAKGKNCSFTCEKGRYLDMASQRCESCPAGTYSLGGGIRYEDFSSLPDGFEIRNTPKEYMRGSSDDKSHLCPKDRGWKVEGGWLMYLPTPCWSILSYNAKLTRPGFIKYTYRLPESSGSSSSLYFSVDAQNSQCESYIDRMRQLLKNKVKEEKGEGGGGKSWRVDRLNLITGQNVISFRASNSFFAQHWGAIDESGAHKDPNAVLEDDLPILISRIDVTGLPYTFECTKCPPGTFSSSESHICSPCKPDTFSERGAESCKQCQSSMYSESRASECKKRPVCTELDYYRSFGTCDEKQKTEVSYKWVQPKICRGGVSLPAARTQPCPQCNPGMTKNHSRCQFCGKQEYSDGNSACSKCPVNTSPNYGYQFTFWNSLPKQLTTSCEIYSEDADFGECNEVDSWLPAGDRLHTAHTRRPGVILELKLRVPGFRNPLLANGDISAQNPIGHLTFTFSTKCSHRDCTLYFAEGDDSEESETKVIANWNGTTSNKKVYRHPITKSGPLHFFWFFVRSRIMRQNPEVDTSYMDDEVSIYMINVTNTLDGGASACLPCPVNTGAKEGCIPCPPGHFIEPSTRKCIQCPTDTILNTSSSQAGAQSCTPCGPHLHSKDGIECHTDGHFEFKSKDGKDSSRFNVAKLFRRYEVQGVKVYGHEGAGFFHVFNVSVSGSGKEVHCYDSYGRMKDQIMEEEADNSDWLISAQVCRATVVPWESETKNQSTRVFTSPMALATRLIGISSSKELDGIRIGEKELDIDSRSPSEVIDTRLFYRSRSGPSASCPLGHSTVITLRCDPLANRTKARLPRECPDGTCDGCVFHIIILSPDACPLCDEGQFKEIRGECVRGHQTIHFIPAKHCVLSGRKQSSRVVPCIIFGPEVQLITGIASAGAILLLCLLLFVCKRNRRLEYKYMKLIEGKSGKDGEQQLPSAESCALEEDEEEDGEEQVVFARGKGDSRRIFPRWNKGDRQDEDKRALNIDFDEA